MTRHWAWQWSSPPQASLQPPCGKCESLHCAAPLGALCLCPVQLKRIVSLRWLGMDAAWWCVCAAACSAVLHWLLGAVLHAELVAAPPSTACR